MQKFVFVKDIFHSVLIYFPSSDLAFYFGIEMNKYIYSKISMTRTPMARLPCMIRTRF